MRQSWDSVLADYAAAIFMWGLLGVGVLGLLAVVFQLGRRRGWEDHIRHEGRMKVLRAIEDELAKAALTQPIPPADVVLPAQREGS